MALRTLLRRLGDADAFGDVGEVVCDYARGVLGCHQSVVSLFASAPGQLAMFVDDVSSMCDRDRTWWVQAAVVDPQVAYLLEHHAPVGEEAGDAALLYEWCTSRGYKGRLVYPRLVPLIEPRGVLGYVRTGPSEPMTRALQRDIDVMVTYASAHLMRLGITRVTDAPRRALPHRQRQVAELAARGDTNAEIATVVGTSVNTVKKQLKQVFSRFGVANRTELASVFARTAPRDNLPTGVTHRNAVSITKATHF